MKLRTNHKLCRYGRVFHPQILLHKIIANLVLFHMSNHRAKEDGQDTVPMEDESSSSCSIDLSDGDVVLKYKQTEAGEPVKKGTKLRILPVGDSITVGYLSDRNGGDGNGYRGQLKKDLSGRSTNQSDSVCCILTLELGDEVVFAGTESSGTMSDGYYVSHLCEATQHC